jgi:hypothetical protein
VHSLRTSCAAAIAAISLTLCASPVRAEDEGASIEDQPLAGFREGFFVRDRHDYARFYPRFRINLDFMSSLGPHVADLKGADGGVALAPRLVVRRMRLELGADFFQQRVHAFASFEGGGQQLSNANGKSELYAALPGQKPGVSTARWAPVEAPSAAGAGPADVWVNVRAAPWLNAMIGQYQAPFSMENRTSEGVTSFMERNLAIRGFVVPAGKETGITLWGDLAGGALAYEIGGFGGDGQNRPQADDRFDWIGRVFARPLPSLGLGLDKAQIGVSARHGDRHDVGYDYPVITTGQGFVLWDPTYKDAQGRVVHVLPSGGQNAIGGELRVPIAIVDVRGEGYWIDNHTREAIDGYQLTNTERLGGVRGVGWYVQASVWPWGDAWVNGDPGMTRPRSPDLRKKPAREKQGLELLALVAGVDARYDGARRGGARDANTPAGDVRVRQYALGANAWITRYLRLTVNYSLYHTPGSGSAENQAVVPGNLGMAKDPKAHLLHELGWRVGAQF